MNEASFALGLLQVGIGIAALVIQYLHRPSGPHGVVNVRVVRRLRR